MKIDCKRLLLLGAIICVILLTPNTSFAQNTDSEPDYDNYILVTVYPDGDLALALQGNQSETYSQWEQSELRNLNMSLGVTVKDEETSTINGAIHIQFDPAYYSQLANFDMDLTGHSDDTTTNLTALINYPGYLGVDGSLGMVIVEPPYGFVMDLMLETTLYYTYYPKEQLQMFVGMVPLFETQLASEIMAASDGNIRLDNLQLLNYEEAPDHASFTISLRLSGDLQKGLMSAYETIGSDLPSVEVPQETPALTLGSFDYHVTFEGSSLTLDVESGGTIKGDFNTELNKLKNDSLQEMLASNGMTSDARAIVSSLLPINLQLQHLVVESTSTSEGNIAETTFTVNGLGIESSSFEPLLVFLEELSKQGSSGNFKLVFEGATQNNQYVAFTVPSNVKEPILSEEQRVVWEMNNVANLKDVTYEVKTKQIETTTLVIGAAVGIAVLGAAAYVAKTRL